MNNSSIKVCFVSTDCKSSYRDAVDQVKQYIISLSSGPKAET